MLFKEIQFPLKEIKEMLDSPYFDRGRALEQQITLLEMKKEHLENLIQLARGIKTIGVNRMNFTAFDTRKMDEYAKEAKASWGHTKEYHEFEEKTKGRTKEENQKTAVGLMAVFSEFGKMKDASPADETVQEQVNKLRDYISQHYFTCPKKILASLGCAYTADNRMTQNIDAAGGSGTAEFVSRAIQVYCGNPEYAE